MAEHKIRQALKNEITEFHIYRLLAKHTKNPKNKDILKKISLDEKSHFDKLKKYYDGKVTPNWFKVVRFFIIAKVLGLTFAVKLMENGEHKANINYTTLAVDYPETLDIAADEEKHEEELIKLLDEKRLHYISSIVLGISDALVELTGALAGFTLALGKSKTIATLGLITGLAASLSMASSEYLAMKHEDSDKSPFKGALFTGGAYVMSVISLIIPFFIFSNPFISLGVALVTAVLIILFFTYYIAVAKDQPFISRFLEMAGLCLSVALISFGIGALVKHFLGVDL